MYNMMFRSLARTVLVAGITFAAAATPAIIPSSVSAQDTPISPTSPAPSTTPASASNFPDVSQDYWARPFIQALAERNILTGFPDGTFKPEQAVTRAEFAAIIQKAFNQTQTRQAPTGGFKDVPSNYWAASAITRAYETGFLSGYPDNTFRPNLQIPKVQAIVALTSGLRLNPGDTATLSNYYSDATAIPGYATSQVAAATQANLVVNYPDRKVLNPDLPLTRAEAAAHLYQALVAQGQLQPIAANLPAASYIVAGTPTANPTPGQTSGDIVSVASASNSFTTLTSLLKSTGLADSLQQGGPFTVFAPTDQAFAALPPETLQRLQQPENRQTLIRLLSYHVVSGQLTSDQLKSGELTTAEGRPIRVKINRDGTKVAVNNAQVIQPNIQASNGVIYPINQVLIPSDISLGGNNGGIDVGRATRGGSSYLGVGGNIGLGGNSALGAGNFAVISKFGLTRNFSVRPGAVIGDRTLVMLPITFDLVPRSVDPTGQQIFSISPFVGAGVAIKTDNADVGLLLTGGVDVPLGNRFTLNGTVNAAFLNQTDVGLLFGVGYNF